MRKLLSFHLTSLDGERISLTLLEAKPFRSGNVLACYRPAARPAPPGTRSGGPG